MRQLNKNRFRDNLFCEVGRVDWRVVMQQVERCPGRVPNQFSSFNQQTTVILCINSDVVCRKVHFHYSMVIPKDKKHQGHIPGHLSICCMTARQSTRPTIQNRQSLNLLCLIAASATQSGPRSKQFLNFQIPKEAFGRPDIHKIRRYCCRRKLILLMSARNILLRCFFEISTVLEEVCRQ